MAQGRVFTGSTKTAIIWHRRACILTFCLHDISPTIAINTLEMAFFG